MTISLEILKKKIIIDLTEFEVVTKIAADLEIFLNQELVQQKISLTHKLHAKSSEIQEILVEKGTELGFQSKKKGLFIN